MKCQVGEVERKRTADIGIKQRRRGRITRTIKKGMTAVLEGKRVTQELGLEPDGKGGGEISRGRRDFKISRRRDDDSQRTERMAIPKEER